jgi:hypothetical protein
MKELSKQSNWPRLQLIPDVSTVGELFEVWPSRGRMKARSRHARGAEYGGKTQRLSLPVDTGESDQRIDEDGARLQHPLPEGDLHDPGIFHLGRDLQVFSEPGRTPVADVHVGHYEEPALVMQL